MRLEIGTTTLEVFDSPVSVRGEAFTGGQQEGTTIACELRAPDGAVLEIGLTSWKLGDRDVRCFSRLAGPALYDRLVKGVRLGVAAKRPGEWSCELGILSHHSDRPPTTIKATWDDLDWALGDSAADVLLAAGASRVGTKEQIFGDTSRRRSYLVMTCPSDVWQPVLTSYVMTRVLPLMHGFGKTGAVPVGLA